jgi:hypothetical protein
MVGNIDFGFFSDIFDKRVIWKNISLCCTPILRRYLNEDMVAAITLRDYSLEVNIPRC